MGIAWPLIAHLPEKGWRQNGVSIFYGQLLAIAGGKERMRHYFDNGGWPPGLKDRESFIRETHALKTNLFMKIIEAGELPLRSGVARLIDEAIEAGIKLAVGSTSHERSVNLIVEKLLGSHRKAKFEAILAGDVVTQKKPNPEIYLLALRKLGIKAHQCVVIEDNRNGLLAAKAAGMHCLVTTSAYSMGEDFSEADTVVQELGDPPGNYVRLSDLMLINGNDQDQISTVHSR